MSENGLLIGIDVGGTFTDAIVLDAEGSLQAAFKLPSTPHDPAKAVIEAIERIAQSLDVKEAVVCHGTTVGTNTLIQRQGAKTALLSTHGFSDILELRRQDRPLLYDFNVRISEPLVPKHLRLGIPERLAADGSVVEPLDHEGIADLLREMNVESIAISFLHSYANGTHEAEIASALQNALPNVFVTRSSDVCPEFREYERTSTTVVNAYVGPSVSKYILQVDRDLRARGIRCLMMVISNGGLTSPENASRYPVHLIESGPAAQLIAAASLAQAQGRPNLVAFDMGGTTAKAGVVRNGQPDMAAEFYADRLVDGRDVGGYAIRSAVLDLVEIGAGGGSIAWIDDGGVLKVGPQSAGAVPGPACYGRGGTQPTVTDAHAVIGTLTPELFAATGVRFDRDAAAQAVRRHVAEPFGWPLARAAHAILDLAVASMAEMVRLATTQRGLDPRDFVLLASGGAGPLHGAAVGREIGAAEMIVPPYPGMFSAIGATLGAVRHEVTHTLLRQLCEIDETALARAFETLSARVNDLLAAEPQGVCRPAPQRILEARFAGQLFELQVPLGRHGEPLPSIAEIEQSFRTRYRSEYGFDLPDADVQAVNLRLIATIDLGHPGDTMFKNCSSRRRTATRCRIASILTRHGDSEEVPVYRVSESADTMIAGPAIIEHSGATVWIHDRQSAQVSPTGQVTVTLSEGSS